MMEDGAHIGGPGVNRLAPRRSRVRQIPIGNRELGMGAVRNVRVVANGVSRGYSFTQIVQAHAHLWSINDTRKPCGLALENFDKLAEPLPVEALG